MPLALNGFWKLKRAIKAVIDKNPVMLIKSQPKASPSLIKKAPAAKLTHDKNSASGIYRALQDCMSSALATFLAF